MAETAIISSPGDHVRSGAESRFKRRNKNSRFLSNAKGFGKKGIFGRGTHIEQDIFSYFINISDTIKQGFESEEDEVNMANNVFEQTVGQEIHLSSNQVVSKVIENLIGFTDPEHFERFQNSFAENFRPICSDEFASHVLQKMIEICFLRAVYYKKTSESENEEGQPAHKKMKSTKISEDAYNTSHSFSKKHRKKCSEFLLKIAKFLLNNLEDFLWDPYANHIIRTSVTVLAGIHKNKVAFERNNQIEKHEKPVEVPSEWSDVVKEYVNRLQMWPQFSDLPYNTLSALGLAHLTIALRALDKNMLKHIGKRILVESFLKVNDEDEEKKKTIEIIDDDDQPEKDVGKRNSNNVKLLPKVFNHGSAIRLLECMLAVAGAKLFTQLNAMLFSGRIKVLALNRSTNFAVQKLIENIKEKAEFESIFDELHESIEDLLKVGHTVVVETLAKSCLRLATKQGQFVSSLLSALHVTGSKEKFDALIPCILKLKPYEIAIKDKSQFIHLHGSVILQHILQFNKPIKIVQSILDIPPEEVALIFSTGSGSFIADTFIKSKTIGEKSREKLLKHLEGHYLSMAGTKFGSRVVENLFDVAHDPQKVKIVKELAERSNQLNATLFGRVIHKKFRIDTYRLSAAQWKASMDKAKKAETLFKDIIK